MRVEVDVRPHINIYIYTYLKSRLNTNITELARFARSLIIQIIIAILAMCDMGCEVTQLQYDTIMYVSDRVVKQQKCCYK